MPIDGAELEGGATKMLLDRPSLLSLPKRKTPELKSGQRGFLVIVDKAVDKSGKLNELLDLFEKFYEDSDEKDSYNSSTKETSVSSRTSLGAFSELEGIVSSSREKVVRTDPNELNEMDVESDDSSTIGDGKHNGEPSTHSQTTVMDVKSPDEKENIPEKEDEEDAGCSSKGVEGKIEKVIEKPRVLETIPVNPITDSSSDSSTSVRLQFYSNNKDDAPAIKGKNRKKLSKSKSRTRAGPTKAKKEKEVKENLSNFLPSHATSIDIKKYENVADIPPNIKNVFQTPYLNDGSPFVPRISIKPNAIMAFCLHEIRDPTTNKFYFENPYKTEIDRWIPKPNSMLMSATDKYHLRQLHETPYNIVHTEGKFEILIKDLKSAPEFAFSTLQSNRSFYGFTCVLAISTRSKDYIIDCFGLRDLLQKLNIYFTHPGVLKVAHNCRTDVEFLQKDFGIYIVGLYDTCEAEKVIQCIKSRKSVPLEQLLEDFLSVKLNTKFQKADWRIRSHYLLKLYDMQKEKLLSINCRDVLYQVYENSKGICRLHYQQPDRESWVLKYKTVFSNQQMYALVALNEWRNEVAIIEDEAPHWIASNKALVALSTVLPPTFQDIVTLSKKRNFAMTSHITKDKRKLLHIFEEAQDLPLVTPQIQVLKRRVVECYLSTKVPTLVFLKSKHDPSRIVYRIMDHFQVEGNFACPNYIQRILPVDITCKTDLNHICKAVEALLDSGCRNESETYEISSNFRFDKQHTLIGAIRKSVKKKNPRWNYTEDGSDICIIIYSIRKLRRCCVSLVDSYRKFNQFYLRPS